MHAPQHITGNAPASGFKHNLFLFETRGINSQCSLGAFPGVKSILVNALDTIIGIKKKIFKYSHKG